MTRGIVAAQDRVAIWHLGDSQFVSNPLVRLYRGIALRREDMPSSLVAQLEAALNGESNDPTLGPSLLNHLGSKGLGEWWTPNPESAEGFSMTYHPQTYVPGGPKPHYQVVVSGDGDTSSAERSGLYWKFKGGISPQAIRVRRQHPDNWLEIPLH